MDHAPASATPRPVDAAARDLPLCVDLDGTLLRSDALLESLLALAARRPWRLAWLPWWLLRGKAHLKARLAAEAALDPALLPYDARVLDLLAEAGAAGRHRVLCTAADAGPARAIAAHLGCIDEVLASDGARNLAGAAKAEALRARFGARGFDYAGNAGVDVAVWAQARVAVVVEAPAALARRAAEVSRVQAHWPPAPGRWREWIRAARLQQWLKNLLVFVPLLAAHRALDPAALAAAALAFLAFGLCASGAYLLNDLLDLDADRRHPRKRARPFAAGRLPLAHGLLAAPALGLAGLALAWWVAPAFGLALAGYVALTLAYSLRLKRIAMLDVLVLAALYTLRIIAGAAAIAVPVSFWLLAFSMFIFLSLALLKRYTELRAMREEGRTSASGRGYATDDLPLLQALGAASGFLSVLVLALYINSPVGGVLYARPEALWLLCPLMLFWISRAWLVAHRGGMHDDPVVFAATDRTSLVVGVLCALVALMAL